jgi:hypothetical protein
MPFFGGPKVYMTPSTPGKAPPGTTDNGDGTFSLSDGTRMRYDNTGNIVEAGPPGAPGGAGGTAPLNYAGLNPAAWQSGPGMLGQPTAADTAKASAAQLADIDKQIADLKHQLTNSYRPGDPRLDKLNDQLIALQKQRATVVADQQAREKADQTDAMQAVIRMRAAEQRQAPTMDRTVIQETTPDFSAANATLAGSDEFRRRQLAEADMLMSGKGGEGQQALIDRLNGDIEGRNGPSLAQLQLEEGRDQTARGAASIANSARGNTMAMAQLEALRSSERSMGDAARSSAILRAQEVAKAREELAGVLNAKRSQELQGYNIAATQVGQGRGQDIQTAGVQSQNSLSAAQIAQATRLAQANLDADTKKANLLAYFEQQGLNQTMAQFWANKYTHEKERPEDLAIDYEKTRQGIIRDNTDRQTAAENRRNDQLREDQAAAINGISSAGMTWLQGFGKSQQGGTGGGGVGGGAPGTPAQQSAANAENAGSGAYQNPYGIVDPWKTP